MLSRKHCLLGILILLLTACISEAQTSQTGAKLKLAVLRVTFEDFSDQEQARTNEAFYTELDKDDRFEIISEAQVRTRLIPLGIEPREIADVTGYVHAGQLLRVDYVLVGQMEKLGNFVEVTFRVFTMPRGVQRQYPGGKTFDILLKEEIPNIIESIYRDLRLHEETTAQVRVPLQGVAVEDSSKKKPGKKPWIWIAIGGAASGLATALLISGGGGDPGAPLGALGRPPIVPK